MCGEKLLNRDYINVVVGSSPHVRGKALPFDDRGRCNRIIPTCAGKRLHDHLSFLLKGNHPHMCGEKI